MTAAGKGIERLREAAEKLLKAYQSYYSINREKPADPFYAEAEFRMHGEHYMLIRAAKVTEYDTRDIMFIATEGYLDAERFEELDRIAWEECLKRTEVSEVHKSTDVSLIILADRVDRKAAELIRKRWHYKSYRFGIRGYNHYRVVAYDFSDGSIVQNRMGSDLTKAIRNIFK